MIAINNGFFDTILHKDRWELFNWSAKDDEQTNASETEWYDLNVIDAALEVAHKNLMLEHARMGRSVHESQDGKIVEVTPIEIFALFGLDENGKPLLLLEKSETQTELAAGR